MKRQRFLKLSISSCTATALLISVFLIAPTYTSTSEAATSSVNFFTNFTAFNSHTLIDSRIHRKVNPMIMKVASYLNYVYQEDSSKKVGVQTVIQDMKDTINNGFYGKLFFITPMSKDQQIDFNSMVYANNLQIDKNSPNEVDNAPQPSSFITVYDESDPKFPSLPYCYVDDRFLGVKRALSEPVVVAIISGDCQAYLDRHKGIQNKYPDKFLPLYLSTPGVVDETISASRSEDSSDILHIAGTGEPIDVRLKLESPVPAGDKVFLQIAGSTGANTSSLFAIQAMQSANDPELYEYVFTKEDQARFMQLQVTCASTKLNPTYWTLRYDVQTPSTGVGSGVEIEKDKNGDELSGTLPVFILRDGCIS